MMRKMAGLRLAIGLLACACTAPAKPIVEADAQPVGAGAWLMRGEFAPGRQPDGNTVLFETQAGLVVIDTGRHRTHADRILAASSIRQEPIVAIVNSHWHLDHLSGNLALKAVWPSATVYANDRALSDALATFLARSAAAGREALAKGQLSDTQAADVRGDLGTVEAAARLHPDVSVESDRTLAIGGRTLELHAASGASEGDIWVYDRRAKLVAAGDLVTLPAPFLDTACPARWRAALDEILDRPFLALAPGHGRLLTPEDVRTYRNAFSSLIACAAGSEPVQTCAEQWAASATPLLDDPVKDSATAKRYAAYYVGDILRSPGARPDWCT